MTMNYNDTIKFLFSQLPMFERQGGEAYKPGLQTSNDLDRMFGTPHKAYKCIHIAGTNGKGSCSHLLATILQQSGYKVGLYTSPHIIDFRERIRVNGEKITQEKVVDFMQRYFNTGYQGHPTFFELTSTMAFDYFKQCKVDYAVIEVGLGGRLDSTNIIKPMLSIITNISLDHTQFLGDTLTEIAGEKAGIIKEGVPVVIGEAEGEVRKVFEQKATQLHSPIIFAQDNAQVLDGKSVDGHTILMTKHYGQLIDELGGTYQIKNANTVLTAVESLKALGVKIEQTSAVSNAFERVCELSGFMGRWQQLAKCPLTVCDSGHNIGAFQHIIEQLNKEKHETLHMVLGFMKDKNIDEIIAMLPKHAKYYFTNAHTPRALHAAELNDKATAHGIKGNCYDSVAHAIEAARAMAKENDMIYIGGSMYVLAEALEK